MMPRDLVAARNGRTVTQIPKLAYPSRVPVVPRSLCHSIPPAAPCGVPREAAILWPMLAAPIVALVLIFFQPPLAGSLRPVRLAGEFWRKMLTTQLFSPLVRVRPVSTDVHVAAGQLQRCQPLRPAQRGTVSQRLLQLPLTPSGCLSRVRGLSILTTELCSSSIPPAPGHGLWKKR